MRREFRRAALVALALALAAFARGLTIAEQDSSFAGEIARLSEPAGAFDTDNLISNESSYAEVVGSLPPGRGGAYLGVGPDQNFTYIARLRPAVAYIIDIRRDNLLLHLLFKALFAESRTRADYLSLLTGRPVPLGLEQWRSAPIEELVAHVDRSTPWPGSVDAVRARVDQRIQSFGVPVSRADVATIDRFHRSFVEAGLDLVFASHGSSLAAAAARYPSLRDLLLARDRAGRHWHYLASEDDFQYVKQLQARDAVIPVVGDVSGPRALKAIGAAIAARHERVSAFYISNVEFYLARDGSYGRFIANLSALPRDQDSMMIRAIFGGDSSRSVTQAIDRLLGDEAWHR